jgi:hypothetical protein
MWQELTPNQRNHANPKEVIIIRKETLEIITSKERRCSLCDMNLVGSTWRGVSLALTLTGSNASRGRHHTKNYYCVRCITKKTPKQRSKYRRTPEELDNFVDNHFSNRFVN